jgi:uncharacterized protein (TIGR02145 family)
MRPGVLAWIALLSGLGRAVTVAVPDIKIDTVRSGAFAGAHGIAPESLGDDRGAFFSRRIRTAVAERDPRWNALSRDSTGPFDGFRVKGRLRRDSPDRMSLDLVLESGRTGRQMARETIEGDDPAELRQKVGRAARALFSEVGMIQDPRDGQVYETVRFGSRLWSTRNLDYATGRSWCYENDRDTCALFGRLYDWSTALHACPSGTHLPGAAEWDELERSRSTGGMHWRSPLTTFRFADKGGTDEYGFGALPGGCRTRGVFFAKNRDAFFWTSSQDTSGRAWSRNLDESANGVFRWTFDQRDGLSVRCVEDAVIDAAPARPVAAPVVPADGEMVAIPAGCFEMGGPPGPGTDDQAPRHRVCVGAFRMDRTEVTERAYASAMGNDPSPSTDCATGSDRDGDCPVRRVTWIDAVNYCGRLGKHLPTEAQWEYAARAGSSENTTGDGDPDHLEWFAWFADNSGEQPHPVGSKRPDAWGLHDMLGNVSEWTGDLWSDYGPEPRLDPAGPSEPDMDRLAMVCRGGDFRTPSDRISPASRSWGTPTDPAETVGFRCVAR